jgi:hypothetical protein
VGPELFIVALFFVFFAAGIGSLVLAIMCAVDSSKYPDWAFQQTGSSKFVWQILPLILLLVCGVAGGVIGLIWYTGKRHEVERAARAGGPPPYYGAVPPPYTPPPPYPPPGPPAEPPQ